MQAVTAQTLVGRSKLPTIEGSLAEGASVTLRRLETRLRPAPEFCLNVGSGGRSFIHSPLASGWNLEP